MKLPGEASVALPPGVSERDVLVEQLRLVYAMLTSATSWTLVVSFVVAWYLRNLGPVIGVWLAVQVALKVGSLIELRWFISDADIAAHPEKVERRLSVTDPVHAAAWASLPWLTYHAASAPQMLLVISVIAGISAGAIVTYGPTIRVLSAYIGTFLVVLTALQFTDAHNTTYGYFSAIIPIYFIGMWYNAYVNSIAARRSILLRFENSYLNAKLAAEAEELKKAQWRAEEANLSKSRFLASASHDLRQPIHALSMLLGAMEGEAGSARMLGLVRQGKAAQVATAELLDALLDFSRAEAGTIVARARPFALQAIFDQLSGEMAVIAQQKGILFAVRESALVLEADPSLTLIILRNLTHNAIRYTASGSVLVAARRKGGAASIEVWDTGIGIAAGRHLEIFEDFLQLDNPERDRTKGLGLGLAIARRIAGLLKTRIDLASKPGRGSVFRFPLPLAPDQSQALVTATGAADAAIRFPARHVLVVDDEAAIRESTLTLFAGWGVSSASAETIEQALVCAQAKGPDLLVCDYRLRNAETGIQAIVRLREAIGSEVPALLVTGDTQIATAEMALPPRCALIHKPMQPEQLLAAANAIFAAPEDIREFSTTS